jgi:hypothetical protein
MAGDGVPALVAVSLGRQGQGDAIGLLGAEGVEQAAGDSSAG